MTRGFAPGDSRAKQAGQQGGAIRGEQQKRASIALWLQRFPGLTPEAARVIYLAGFNAGWQAGARARKREAQ